MVKNILGVDYMNSGFHAVISKSKKGLVQISILSSAHKPSLTVIKLNISKSGIGGHK